MFLFLITHSSLSLSFNMSRQFTSHHHEPSEIVRRCQLSIFRNRQIMPSYSFNLAGFDKYDILVLRLVYNLGWLHAIPMCPRAFCPEPVCIFYANLRISHHHPLHLQSIIHGIVIRLTPEIVAAIMPMPLYGFDITTMSQLDIDGFNREIALKYLAARPFDPNCPFASCLPEHL
ncbi:hypothetical protein LINGRAHAP2_LOCUS2424 [Linum grandiflorum]